MDTENNADNGNFLNLVWSDMDSILDNIKCTECQHTNTCTHSSTYTDSITSDLICYLCGMVIENEIFMGQEWNNYRDDLGNYSKNTQRSDCYGVTNPIKFLM